MIWGFKCLLEQTPFVSLCLTKVDRLCARKEVYLTICWCEKLQAGFLPSCRRRALGKADVLLELNHRDF